jgi:hypothetical protein
MHRSAERRGRPREDEGEMSPNCSREERVSGERNDVGRGREEKG